MPPSIPLRVTCTDCGDVKIKPRDVVELVRSNPENPGFFAFNCPLCFSVKKKEITNLEIFKALVFAGVSETTLPPITENEAEMFAQELEDESYLVEIIELEE